MLFVVSRDGVDLMSTESVKCIPDKEMLVNMQKNGYKFKLDNKNITVQKIVAFVAEQIAHGKYQAIKRKETKNDL